MQGLNASGTPEKMRSGPIHSTIESKQQIRSTYGKATRDTPYDSPGCIATPALKPEDASQYGSKVELQNLEIDIQVKVI